MQARIGTIVIECLVDLGITVVYAVGAGLLIVAVVATDDTAISILHAALYAALLPGAVLLLIGIEIAARLFRVRRAPEPRTASLWARSS